MKKFNLSNIMKSAWNLFKAGRASTFAEALCKAWANAKAILEVIKNIGCEAHTWSAWKDLEREVIHGSKCVAQVKVFDPYTKNGTRVLSYFTYEQTCPIGSQD